jgi:predicted RNase H-like HicB family nuclease
MRNSKIVVEKHEDGYVAYPLGVKGVVVGEGDSYEKALADVKSAIEFHIETFGDEDFENPDGTRTPLTMPNHRTIEGSTLRTICNQAGISRDEFLQVYEGKK